MVSVKREAGEVLRSLTPPLLYGYLFFVLAYAALTLLPAPPPAILALYGVSATVLRLIYLSIIIILAVIWLAGVYGYAKLSAYARVIRKDKDGQQVTWITRGVLLIVLWLPVSSTVSELLKLIAEKHPDVLAASTVVNNYINLLLPLAGFVLVGYGAHGLSNLVRMRPDYKLVAGGVLFLTYIGLIYTRLVFTTGQRGVVYRLSAWELLLTIIVPYVFMWMVGLIAVFEIHQYRNMIGGILYKKSWTNLAIGLGWLILTSMVFQYLTTLSARLQHLSIYGILAIVYVLLLVLSVGFVFIALGAKDLQRLEEA